MQKACLAWILAILALAVTTVAKPSPQEQGRQTASHDGDSENKQSNLPVVVPPEAKKDIPFQPPAPKEGKESVDKDPSPTDWWARISNALMALATLALAVIGTIAACIAIRTLRAIEAQTKAAKESILLSHRPRLIVRNVVSPQLELLHPLASTQDLLRLDTLDRFEGYFQVANVGNTPAVIQSIQDNILINRLPMERQYSSNTISEIRLAAGESRRIELTSVNVPAETQGVIVREGINVYVIGLIAYTDGLGIRRETAFCRRLDRGLQRLVPVADQDYEYAD